MWELILLFVLGIVGILYISGNKDLIAIANMKSLFTKEIHEGYMDVNRTSANRYKISFYSLKTKQTVSNNLAPLESENFIIRLHDEGEISQIQKNEGLLKIKALLSADKDHDSGNIDTQQNNNYIHLDVELPNNIVYIKYYSHIQHKNVQDSTTPETLKNWLDTHSSSKDINKHQYDSGINGYKLIVERNVSDTEKKDISTSETNIQTDTNINTGLSSGSNALNNGGLM